GPTVGIDLGTTNSGVAYVDEAGKCISIPLSQDKCVFPSTITVDKRSKWTVGAHQPGQQPKSARIAFLTKRVLGRKSNDGRLRSDLEGLPFELYTTGDLYIDGESLVDKGPDELVYPEELAGLTLMEAKRVAEEHLNKRIKKCVIAIPAYFTHDQRQATRDAARIAGLEIVRLVNEPSAAAIAYAHKSPLRDGMYLVCDIGGGTFDVSLLRLENQSTKAFVVKATGGDNCLGGEDFTRVLMDLLYEKTGFSKDDSDAARKARAAAEQFKQRLSRDDEVEGDVADVEVTVTKAEFLEKSAPVFERIKKVIVGTLRERRKFIREQEARAEGKNVEKVFECVLPVGGASFTPGYLDAVRAAAGGDVLPPQDVSLLVAQGAAYVAAGRAVLTDVTSRGLGIKLHDGSMELLIAKNAALPAPSPVKEFQPAEDFLEATKIELLQGENTERAEDNILLGEFDIGHPKRPSDEVRIMAQAIASVDESISVAAWLEDGGKKESLTVTAVPRFDDRELDRHRAKNLTRFNTRSSKRPREGDSS
ncbi:heat shock protein 70 family, partial [Coniochaeta sp. 2T2.1]